MTPRRTSAVSGRRSSRITLPHAPTGSSADKVSDKHRDPRRAFAALNLLRLTRKRHSENYHYSIIFQPPDQSATCHDEICGLRERRSIWLWRWGDSLDAVRMSTRVPYTRKIIAAAATFHRTAQFMVIQRPKQVMPDRLEVSAEGTGLPCIRSEVGACRNQRERPAIRRDHRRP